MIALIANWKRIIYGSALALLGTLLLVQTARIDGFLFWDGLKAENEKLTSQIVSIKEAQKLATKLPKRKKPALKRRMNERQKMQNLTIRNGLLTTALLLTAGCAHKLDVRPGTPICPKPAKPPAELLEPAQRPSFLIP